MKDINGYISSGIIEMYVLGLTTGEENKEIQTLSLLHPEISAEISEISEALLHYKKEQPKLSPNIKPLVMATIDYTERLKNGEQPAQPPLLNETSSPADFSDWVQRTDMVFNQDFGDTYAKIISYTPHLLTAIVWMKNLSPYEIHDAEYEKFLILEGSCNIVTHEKVISLKPGDYYSLPLHVGHTIKVTSHNPCKIILQRVAA